MKRYWWPLILYVWKRREWCTLCDGEAFATSDQRSPMTHCTDYTCRHPGDTSNGVSEEQTPCCHHPYPHPVYIEREMQKGSKMTILTHLRCVRSFQSYRRWTGSDWKQVSEQVRWGDRYVLSKSRIMMFLRRWVTTSVTLESLSRMCLQLLT